MDVTWCDEKPPEGSFGPSVLDRIQPELVRAAARRSGKTMAAYGEVRRVIGTHAIRRALVEALDPAAALVHAQTFSVRGAAGATLESRR